MLIVGLALAPLAAASIIQSVLNFNAYQRETNRILIQTALYAAYNEQNIFARAEQLLKSFAGRPELTADAKRCRTVLSDALIGAMPIVNLTRVDADGRVVCMGASERPIRTMPTWWPKVRGGKRVIIADQAFSNVLRRQVLPIVYPIRGGTGEFLGALSAAVDLHWLETAPQISKLPSGTLSLLLDSTGSVLASNREVPPGLAQAVMKRARGARQETFTAAGQDGALWRWVAEPIGISDKYVAFGIPEPRLLATFRGYLLADVLLTVLIVLASCVAIWMGTEWLVIRWTLYLKRVAVAYGRNHFSLSLEDLNAAPNEFRLLGREMKRMANAIQDRDRTLSESLKRQSAMTREIHHRVKNNLQIVSSLINIYAQTVTSPMSRNAFRQIMARVDSLTLIQRLIEGNDSEPTIAMKALLENLADQLRALASDCNQILTLRLDVEHRYLPPDIATPIALFAIEALTFDMFVTRSELRWRDASLSFRGSDGGYLLTIEDQCPGALPMGAPNPERVLRSLADQLRARYAIEQLEHGGCRIALRLPHGVSLQEFEAPEDAAPNVYAFETSRAQRG